MLKDLILYSCVVVATVVFLIFSLWLMVLGSRFIKLCKAAINVLEKQRPSADNSPQPKFTGNQESGQSKKTIEIPPEILAPSLKKPPRSPGGFGSSVRDVDK